MKVLGILIFIVLTVSVSARHRKEWQRVDPSKASRERLHVFYTSDIPACTRGAGFYRDPADCHQFIRCVDEFGNGRHFNVYVGRCEPGLVFDENVSACNWPELAAPCGNSPQKLQETRKPLRPEQVAQDNAVSNEQKWDTSYPQQQKVIQMPQESNSYDSEQQEILPVVQEIQIAAQEPSYQDEIQQTAEEAQEFEKALVEQTNEQVFQEKFQEPMNQQQNFEQVQGFEEGSQEKIQPVSDSHQEQINAHQQQIGFEEPISGNSQDNRDSMSQQVQSVGFQEILDVENQQFEKSSNVQQQIPQQETQSQWWVPENSAQYNPSDPADQIQTPNVQKPIFCSEEGFFRHPENCSQFIRCVKVERNAYAVHFFECPKQLMFSDNDSSCIVADINSCRSNVRKKRQASNTELQCRSEGFFRHPDDCRSFYRCVKTETGSYETHLFSCPAKLVFDEEYTTCNWPEKAPPCNSQEQQLAKKPVPTERKPNKPPTRTTSKVTVSTMRPRNDFLDKSITQEVFGKRRSTEKPKYTTQTYYSNKPKCRSPGFFRNEYDCTKFIKCVRKDNRYIRYDLSCPKNFAYDDRSKRCIAQRYVTTCKPPRQDDEETTKSPETTSQASSTSSPSDSGNEDIVCEKEGYFRHPKDCNKFYRCVDFNGDGQEFVRYDFNCPEGLVFDEENSVCNWPDESPPCDSESGNEGNGGDGRPGENGETGGGEETGESGTGEEEGSNNESQENTGSTSGEEEGSNNESQENTGSTSGEEEDSNNESQENTGTTSGDQSVTDSVESTSSSSKDDNSEGQKDSGDESDNTESEDGCTKEGFYRNPDDCNKFYRCVDFNEDGKEFVRYDFTCPEGLVFDEANSVCNWPSDSEPCDTRSGGENEGGNNQEGGTTSSTTNNEDSSGGDQDTSENEQNPEGGNTSTESSSNENQSTSSGTATTQSSTRSSEGSTAGTRRTGGEKSNGECTEEGFFRNPDDCNKFYRCVDHNGDGEEFVKYDFTCPEGLVFDEENSVCNWPDQSAPCDGSTTGKGESTTTEEGEENDSSQTTSSDSGSSSALTTTENPSTEAATSNTDDERNSQSTDSNESGDSTTEETNNTPSGGDDSRSTSGTTKGDSGNESGENQGECTEEGYFRNPDDCGKFYRCVDFNGDGKQFVRYDFECPEGLVFDEVNSVCNWPDQSPPCETNGSTDKSETTTSGEGSSALTETSSDQSTHGSTHSTESASEQSTQGSTDSTERSSEQSTQGSTDSTESSSEQPTQSSTTDDSSECSETGFYRCEDDCNKFYRCVDENGKLVRYDFKCPDGLIFDDRNKKCDYPSSELTCDTDSSTTSSTTSTYESTTSASTSQSTTESTTSTYESTTAASTSQSTTESTTSSSSSATSSSTSSNAECTEEGFFRNPDDCSKYYRCIDEGDGTLKREDYSCAEDEVFDEEMRYCNRKDLAPPCDDSETTSSESQSTSSQSQTTDDASSQSTTETTTTSQTSTQSTTTSGEKSDCTEPGFFRCPEDCTKFYRCVEENRYSGKLVRYDFQCPDGLIFDERNNKCDRPSSELTCDTDSTTSSTYTTQSSTTESQTSDTTSSDSTSSGTSSSSGECTEEGYFRNPEDCSKYYRCIDEGDGTLKREDFACAEDEVFDEEMRYCNRKDLAPPCDDTGSSTTESGGGSTGQTTSDQEPESTTSSSGTTGSSDTTTSSGTTGSSDTTTSSGTTGSSDTTTSSGTTGSSDTTTSSGTTGSSDTTTSSGTTGSSDTTTSSGTTGSSDTTTSSGTTGSSDTTTSSGTTSGSSGSGECEEEGFHRDPNDCSKFYRCVDFRGDGQSFTRYDFDCPEGLVFDETNDVCNWPSSVPSCESSGESGGTTGSDSSTSEGNSGSSTRPEDERSTSSTADDQGSSTSDDQGSSTSDDQGSSTSDDQGSSTSDDQGSSTSDDQGSSTSDDQGSSTSDDQGSSTSDDQGSSTSDDQGSSTTRGNDGTTDNSSKESSSNGDSTSEGSTTPNDSTSSESTTSRGGSSNNIECKEEGFFRHPEDCNKFYRCVDFKGTGESFVRYDFDCPEGLHFDEVNSVCNWPTMTPGCESGSSGKNESSNTDSTDSSATNGENSSQSTASDSTDNSGTTSSGADATTSKDQTTHGSTSGTGTNAFSSEEFRCEEEGYFKHPSDCKKYYECKRDEETGELVKIDCECPDGQVWDNEGRYCNAEELSPPCENGSSFKCKEEGFFRDPEDCTRYYQCNRTGSGENDFTYERFQCDEGLVFDEDGRYCNAPELSEPCDESSSTSSSNTDGDSSSTSSSNNDSNSSTSSDSSTDDDSGSNNQGECTKEGFFRHPEDCTKYYQCTENENTGGFDRTDHTCPDGRIFDEGPSYCNDPQLSEEPCETTTNDESTSQQTTNTDSSKPGSSSPSTENRRSGGNPQCNEEGFFRHPDDCNKFYRCVDFSGSGESYVRYDFDCPEGLHFDEVNSVCNWPTMTPPCESSKRLLLK